MTAVPPEPATEEVAPRLDAEACVIGAGAAGLAAGKALADAGVTFDWFEKGSMVGGLWQIGNDNGGVAAYRTLHLNSSRVRTQYPSFPMPGTWPDYPSHTLMAQYFEDFARTFGLHDRITFRTPVTRVEPVPGDGPPGSRGWSVTTDVTGTRHYQHVLVANGHHGTPRYAQLPGEFTGEVIHSHEYRDPSVFADKVVVIIGVGNSGVDLACDAVRSARAVNLVTRRGVHVLPKYAFGRPLDTLSLRATSHLPFVVERTLYEGIVRVTTGRPQDRGLPRPDHRLLSAHPTVSAELYDRVGHGDITVRRGITAVSGRTIRFADGSCVEADLLVHATGYQVTFPFLAPEVFDVTENRMPLYQRVVAPERPGLFFIGFIQPVGSSISLTEPQAQWVADMITGRCVLPSVAHMQRWIAEDAAAMAARYTASTRHTMQVDYWRYERALRHESARTPAVDAGGPAARIRDLLRVPAR
jgi:cation diffusion facilitator CzcD-associated flavoprotein CzcO